MAILYDFIVFPIFSQTSNVASVLRARLLALVLRCRWLVLPSDLQRGHGQDLWIWGFCRMCPVDRHSDKLNKKSQMLHGAGLFTNIHHDFPTTLGHFWGRCVGKSSSTMEHLGAGTRMESDGWWNRGGPSADWWLDGMEILIEKFDEWWMSMEIQR